MLRIFKGNDEQWYYQVMGRNGQVMVTSEGYPKRSNAVRGFADLCDALEAMDDLP